MAKVWQVEITCPNCGERFTCAHWRQLYCTKACKAQFSARQKVRGQLIVTEMMGHRMARNARDEKTRRLAADAWATARRLLDQWIQEDRAAGRPSALWVLELQGRLEAGA